MIAAQGIVSTHAQRIRPATPHFTADKRRVAPTPTMAPGDGMGRGDRCSRQSYVSERQCGAGLGAKAADRF